jgi:Zn-dependent protease
MIYVFQIIVLIFSAIVHEYMHGWMAYRLGDSTAKDAGRLTFNPLAHLEWFGSFFLPLVMIISNMPFVFGWAKPVPYNPYNLRDRKYGDAKVAIAGPLGNLVIALFFGLFLRFIPFSNLVFTGLISLIVYINLVLMVFNLLPIPPLDGSKILAAFLPSDLRARYLNAEKFGFILVILFVMLAGGIIMPLVELLYRIITGA